MYDFLKTHRIVLSIFFLCTIDCEKSSVKTKYFADFAFYKTDYLEICCTKLHKWSKTFQTIFTKHPILSKPLSYLMFNFYKIPWLEIGWVFLSEIFLTKQHISVFEHFLKNRWKEFDCVKLCIVHVFFGSPVKLIFQLRLFCKNAIVIFLEQIKIGIFIWCIRFTYHFHMKIKMHKRKK